MRSTAKLLRVDTNTVIKHLRRIRTGKTNSETEKDTGATTDSRRKEWLQLVADNSQLSTKGLRKLKPALYTWLYRHDNLWLISNSSRNKPVRSPNKRIDWEARDRQMAEAVRNAMISLGQQQESSHAITISKIGKMIGALAILQQHLDKLPETKSVLTALPTIFAKGRK